MASTSTAGAQGLKVLEASPVVLDDANDAAVGITIRLHPLPIINMSEHLVRSSVQPMGGKSNRIAGALLGNHLGREVEIHTTFELLIGEEDRIDQEYLRSRQAQFKQVFPTFDLLGWYSSGSIPLPQDMAIHRQLLEYNESPLFLQLSPSQKTIDQARSKGELPIGIYETFVDVSQSIRPDQGETAGLEKGPDMYFRPANYQIETGEAERIAVDHTSKPPVDDGDGQSSLIANLTTQQNAIKMLLDRIQSIVSYVDDVEAKKLPNDHESLRQIASLVAGIPASGNLPEFRQEFLTEYNDLLLTTYLSDMTNGINTMNELVDKFDFTQVGNDDGLGGIARPSSRFRSGRGATRMGRNAKMNQ